LTVRAIRAVMVRMACRLWLINIIYRGYVMDNKEYKKEMQDIIINLLKQDNYNEAYDAFVMYGKVYISDEFIEEYKDILYNYGPKVSVICMNCEDEVVDNFIKKQNYNNYEIVRTTKEDSYKDIIDYMKNTDSKYITFLENNAICSPSKISKSVWRLELYKDIQIINASWQYINSDTVIAHPDIVYKNIMNDKFYSGYKIIEQSIICNDNIYGSLSSIMVSTEYIRNVDVKEPCYNSDRINRLALLFQLLMNANMAYINEGLLSLKIGYDKQKYNKDRKAFYTLIQDIMPDVYEEVGERVRGEVLSSEELKEVYNNKNIAKCITFIYTDKGEYYNVKPIGDEAVKRGYSVKYTENIKEKAEIGIYCQHVCYPENSRFSMILLHDMAQGHNRWPNIWEIERWSKFDVGILPGVSWSERLKQCACMDYVNPRIGAYELGYPKSDIVYDEGIKQRTQELRKKFNVKYDYTILYAPSWEYFNKEDDFIKALSSLKVNLVVKQASWPESYSWVTDSINEMRKMHEGILDNLYYIESEESIMVALEMCDMVVSDESNVMAEALMLGKPSVAVTDWLIPDKNPPRCADVTMDYVIKCRKAELRETVENVMNNPDKYKSVMDNGKKLYSNQGNVCKDIMDLIDYYTQNGDSDSFMDKKITVDYSRCGLWI
jgi:hypothetical protein